MDLLDILEFYIKQNGTSAYSRRLNSMIDKSLKLVAKNPLIGVQTDNNSVRVFIKGDYEIIYEVFEQSILIIMLWDCRRNPEDKMIEKRVK